MANYDPPQSLWKRNLAAILDGVVAFVVSIYLVTRLFGNRFDLPEIFGTSNAGFSLGDASFSVGGGSALLASAFIIAYFVLLGRTGGTVFQRLFGMKRVTSRR